MRERAEKTDIWVLNWKCRADQKTAEDYALEGGNTLHLVLALRGGGGGMGREGKGGEMGHGGIIGTKSRMA